MPDDRSKPQTTSASGAPDTTVKTTVSPGSMTAGYSTTPRARGDSCAAVRAVTSTPRPLRPRFRQRRGRESPASALMLGMELVQRCDVFRLWIGGRVCPLQHLERFPRPPDPLLRCVVHELLFPRVDAPNRARCRSVWRRHAARLTATGVGNRLA